jgi:hypothetical protein
LVKRSCSLFRILTAPLRLVIKSPLARDCNRLEDHERPPNCRDRKAYTSN